MTQDFRTLKPEILDRWYAAAEKVGIPKESYQLTAEGRTVKVVRDPSGKSDFTFGVIHNSYRFERHKMASTDCPLCVVVDDVQNDPSMNLDLENKFPGSVVRPNIFPIVKGVSMAIAKGSGDNEKKMYTTKNLDGLVSELRETFAYADGTGFQAFHNSEGAGASIPGHEHWHLTNYGEIYNLAGEMYGFENAETTSLKNVNGVKTMNDYPFAHLIFDQNDPEKIVHFLSKLGHEIGNQFDNGAVPHGIAQGKLGILVVPFKNYMKKGIGSGDIAGHIPVQEKEEFDKADHNYCTNKLRERLFTTEINLANFL